MNYQIGKGISMKRISIAFALILTALLLAGCADLPNGAAREWYKAMLNMDGNKILDRTCAAQVPNVQQAGLWGSAFALLPQMFGLNMQSKGDVSSINFSTISIQGDTAQVKVSGKIRVAVLAYAQETPIDETWTMVREDNKWKWCGTP